MANEIDQSVAEVPEESQETPQTESKTTDWEAEANKWKGMYRREQTKNVRLSTTKQEAPEKVEPKQSESFGLMEKAYLRAAGITASDEVELAETTSKKWGMPVDKLVDDEDFQAKLEKLRIGKSNAEATNGVRGDGSSSGAKDVDWYINQIDAGRLTADQLPKDKKLRQAIVRKKMAQSKDGSKFYND